MHKAFRFLGGQLAHYLQAQARGPYPHPAADPALLRQILRPADVILVEGRQRISGAIKYVTQSTWSHAVLCIEAAADRPACRLLEADVEHGVRTFLPEDLAGYHLRICRPVGLSEADAKRVIAYAIARIGNRYDLKNVFDLARYLLPVPPVRTPWRRRMLALGSSDPTRAICSTLIAQAFQSVGFPILPIITHEAANDPACRDCVHEHYHIRHYSLFVPRDFDVSPYFQIIKPGLSQGDYHNLSWASDQTAIIRANEAASGNDSSWSRRRISLTVDRPHYSRAMIAPLKNCMRIVLTPVHLQRTLLIASVIGSWLNLFNHGDELLHGIMNAHLAAKLALNYLTPFVVSNVGLLARQRH